MKLVPTDESRRKRMQQWFYRATMSGDDESRTLTCNPPSNLIALPSASTIEFSWSYESPVPPGSFTVQISPNEDFSGATEISTEDLSHLWSGLNPNTTYYLRVRFEETGCLSEWSSTSTTTEQDTGPVLTVDIIEPGSGYLVTELLTLDGGDGNCQLLVDAIDGGGGITAVTVFTPGDNYMVSNYPVIGGSGTGAQFQVTSVG